MTFSTPLLPEEMEVMALPSLRDYYLTAQLRPLVYWCNPLYVAKWKTIELFLIEKPIQSFLGHFGEERRTLKTESPWVIFCHSVWQEIAKSFQHESEVKLL